MKSRPVRRPTARKPRAQVAEPLRPAGMEVKIAPAKGRPMLTWVGKRPPSHITAFPAQHFETFDPASTMSRSPFDPGTWKDWPAPYPKDGLLFHGDNKEVLAHLLANGFRGKVQLIYIDPPFDSGADYVRKISLRGVKGKTKLEGEEYTLGEQIQYTDIWANDNYLQFMYERLLLLKELLSEGGSIFVHADYRKNHHLRFLLDEIFGQDSFVNEIIWRSTTFTGSSKAIANRYPTNHNTIYWYHRGGSYKFNKVKEPYKDEYLARFTNPDDDPRGSWQSVSLKTYSQETFERLKAESRLIPAQSPGAGWRFKFYLSEAKGKVVETLWLDLESQAIAEERRALRLVDGGRIPTIWLDINVANAMAEERTGYPTEKPDDLLARIVVAHSDPGDIVLDSFAGAGTSLVAAQRLGRRWIGCDINKGAVQTTSKRLQTIILEQIKASAQGKIVESDSNPDTPPPAQLAFTIWRVNDYDLAIQHNEAVNLACEHIGVQRTRTDTYFDGTLGRSLIKIIPFDHPLSPIDLEELRRELDARPDEDRTITLVSLGIELAAQAWIEEWNRLRKGKEAVNRVEVIELRTDSKYGKFIKHEPARAKVKIARRKDQILVEIEDFISPTIIERLQQQAGILSPKIDDWRAMVDVVMIDPAYDGRVFNVALSDVPERKSDLVTGRYELPAPKGDATVAVKIIDMLGEEVLVTEKVPG